jgi:hypothetical protein
MSYVVKMIMGAIGTALMLTFVGGLSQSISTGFAGFWGGLPFMLVAILVGCCALYDFWEECLKKK